MGQMNVSVTNRLSGYVKKKVRSGQYHSASEVVREALRRMQEEDARALRLAKPAAEDILADLDAQQMEAIRARVGRGIEEMRAGKFVEIDGPGGLAVFAERIKGAGRKTLSAAGGAGSKRKRGS